MKLVLGLLFFFVFKTANAIRCYECMGPIDLKCSFENFNASDYTPVDCNSDAISCLRGFLPGNFTLSD